MAMSYLESEALCPYFVDDTMHFITCEAGKILTKDKGMHRELGYDYCALNYEKCTLKIALDHYYDRNSVEVDYEESGEDSDGQVAWNIEEEHP